MKEYSYIGVGEEINDGFKVIVKSSACPIHEGNIVRVLINDIPFYAEILHAAFLLVGSEEESMLAEFGEIHEVEKIYGLAWDKKKEEMKNA